MVISPTLSLPPAINTGDHDSMKPQLISPSGNAPQGDKILGGKRSLTHPLLRSGNFFPPRDRGGRTAPVTTAAALERSRERKGWDAREEDVFQQPHSFDPFIPYQGKGWTQCINGA